jgi:hypothetical protein
MYLSFSQHLANRQHFIDRFLGLLPKRLPLRGWYKGKEYRASLRKDGQIQYDGQLFDSPTGAAKKVVGRVVNGWTFWHYKSAPREWAPLAGLKL